MFLGKEFVYLDPPKTASVAVSRWLMRENPGTVMCGRHFVPTDTAEYPKGCLVFATVRRPLERALSWWSHRRRSGEGKWRRKSPHIPTSAMNCFDEFVRYLSVDPNGPPAGGFGRTQYSMLSQCPRFGEIVICRVENLRDDIAKLGIGDARNLIVENKGDSNYPIPQTKTVEMIREMYAEDYERWYS